MQSRIHNTVNMSTLFSASPCTIDFIAELNANFKTIVTEKLDKRCKEAILTQQDPDTMTVPEAISIRNSISKQVYGNILKGIVHIGRNIYYLYLVADPDPQH